MEDTLAALHEALEQSKGYSGGKTTLSIKNKPQLIEEVRRQ